MLYTITLFVLFFQLIGIIFTQEIEVKSRILVGGRRARANEFPNHVGIVLKPVNKFCGGTIIDDDWVLTAAHCFYRNNELAFESKDVEIVLKALDISSKEAARVSVEKIFIHPNYKPKESIANDIALIKITGNDSDKDNVIMTKAITPFSNKTSYVGRTVWIVGYGKESNSVDEQPKGILKTVDIEVLEDNVCKRLFPNQFNHRLMMCAGHLEGGKGACFGDAGGALVLKKENNNGNQDDDMQTILGFVSGGTGRCAEKGTGDVYTKVSSYISWIAGIKQEYQENKENGSE